MPKALLVLLDMSCLSKGTLAAPEIANGSVLRYSRKRAPFRTPVEEEKGRKGFLIALYACHGGYGFADASPEKMFCSKGEWIGKQPVCIPGA